jgi:hypothetical protein
MGRGTKDQNELDRFWEKYEINGRFMFKDTLLYLFGNRGSLIDTSYAERVNTVEMQKVKKKIL